MKKNNEYYNPFPDYFAPIKFENSWSSLYFNLESNDQILKSVENIVVNGIYLDSSSKLQFKITDADAKICEKLNAPLPFCHYVSRIKDHMTWIPYDGYLRKTVCSVTNEKIYTNWRKELDQKILSTKKYLEMFV